MSTTDVDEEAAIEDDYLARFCEHDGRVVECTIYPRAVDESRVTTTWISAAHGSFVDLASVR
jgi:hypothetical protein